MEQQTASKNDKEFMENDSPKNSKKCIQNGVCVKISKLNKFPKITLKEAIRKL